MPKTPKTEEEWAAWKADARRMADAKVKAEGRKEGIEEAALYMEERISPQMNSPVAKQLMAFAAGIRALKESTP